MKLDDNLNNFKCFREHTLNVERGYKAVKSGFTVTDQDEKNGEYVEEDGGDEGGWAYWPSFTFDIGTYAQATPAIVSSQGGLRPLKNKSLAVDLDYDELTISLNPGKYGVSPASGEIPDVGAIGLVVQCLNQDNHEKIFFQGGSSATTITSQVTWGFDAVLGDQSVGKIGVEDIYIDMFASNPARFENCGTESLYEVVLIGEAVRKNIKKSLYKVISLVTSSSRTITHANIDSIFSVTKNGVTEKYAVGKLITNIENSEPWVDEVKSSVYTGSKKNRMAFRIPAQWSDLKGFVEVYDISRGLPFYARPIDPVLVDSQDFTAFESNIRLKNIPIGTYTGVLT